MNRAAGLLWAAGIVTCWREHLELKRMRAETESLVEEIKRSLGLLRRHL
ncbi:MAG: hypothetical protein AB7K04_01505 [Pseudorhodoplanes sp.]